MHYFDNCWYMYFAAKSTDTLDHKVDGHKIYVLCCREDDPILGTWIELGSIRTNWNSFSLDATTFKHRGIRYIVWAQMYYEIEGNSSIYIAKMKSPYEIAGKQIMLTKPELPWETIGSKVNEGPAVIIHNDRIILTYSGSATDAN